MLRCGTWASLLLLVAGCAGETMGDTDMGPSGADMSMAATKGLKVTPNVIAGVQPGLPLGSSSDGLGSSQSTLRVGSNSAASLLSLKYYIQFIQICQSLEVSGSGWSNPNHCLTLYQNPEITAGGNPYDGTGGVPKYDDYLVTQAQADTAAGRYIDLMSTTGQEALRQTQTVTAESIGAYKYGLISFYRPIKVTATFPVLGSATDYFRTKAVTGVVDNSIMGGLPSERSLIGDTLSGATEETTYMLNNGGTFFVFQKPFEITQADIDAGTAIKVDLVFNPDSFGQATENTSSDCSTNQYAAMCDAANHVTIDMPFVRMSPVPRKAGEKTRKETYLLDYGTGPEASKLRVELYYNDADAEKSIQGVDTAVVFDATATSGVGNALSSPYVSQTGSVSTNDAVVTLQDFAQTPNLEGLKRRTNGTATLHCIYTGTLCPTSGTTVSLAYTYAGDSIVSSD